VVVELQAVNVFYWEVKVEQMAQLELMVLMEPMAQ
jgi:hypothetical protein